MQPAVHHIVLQGAAGIVIAADGASCKSRPALLYFCPLPAAAALMPA
jgi:hypothetical protein